MHLGVEKLERGEALEVWKYFFVLSQLMLQKSWFIRIPIKMIQKPMINFSRPWLSADPPRVATKTIPNIQPASWRHPLTAPNNACMLQPGLSKLLISNKSSPLSFG